MKELIYYPNFESTNANWLKFALLYVDKLNPIIPPTGDNVRSYLYDKLINETDLIAIHRPGYDEGYRSSLDAIDIATKVLEDPHKFDTIFNRFNAPKGWGNSNTLNAKLFEEKYSHEWKYFCLRHGFAVEVPGGLLMSNQLASLYMVVLANTIADSTGKSVITDQNKIDKMSFFLRNKAPNPSKDLSNANAVLSLKLPSKISNITFDEIIKLRNSRNFKKYRRAFHSELDNFYKNIEEGKTEQDFVEKYKNSISDFSEGLLTLSIDTIAFGLGTSLLLTKPEYTHTEFYRSVVLAGAGLVVKTGYTVKKTWRNTEAKRHCRRYLTKLSRLKYS